MTAVDVHVVESGPPDAPVVLMAGSLGSSLEMWEPQVAALSGSIQAPSPASPFDAWWSMTTRGSAAKSSAWRVATEPTRSSDPQSDTTSRS